MTRRRANDTLRPELIIATIEKLRARIAEGFPEAGIGRVYAELADTAGVKAREASRLTRPFFG